MTAEAEQVAERANDALDQTPTLTEASGCMDCNLLFRCGSKCVYCGSSALLNVADIINSHNITKRMNDAREGIYIHEEE